MGVQFAVEWVSSLARKTQVGRLFHCQVQFRYHTAEVALWIVFLSQALSLEALLIDQAETSMTRMESATCTGRAIDGQIFWPLC